ncbi:sel1 repeat family protein [Variovorax sp. dw_308]|uniref:SEL1-like repeat protein n=1 Tax=Variovorax sp. dw_308 TaxID=2721546 RepID=UPI001C442A35|nr:sel1 repeat family protein [Variovorax sp. dw_308]
MTTLSIDWKALTFQCAHEKDTWPKVAGEPDAEVWFQRGSGLHRAGTAKDDEALLKEAFALTKRAAEHGHVLAMNNLVVMYLDGDGVKPSDANAVEWAEKLIAMNIGMGYYHMGTFLQQGIGVTEDRKAALSYFRRAADLGNAQGQLSAGETIRKAVAQLGPDEKERGFAVARAMFQCALDQGLGEAGYALARQYVGYESKPKEALMAYQAAAKLGHVQSLFDLWVLFRDGEYGFEKDVIRSGCYERLWREREDDRTKKFPDIDRICPLPPKRMPRN